MMDNAARALPPGRAGDTGHVIAPEIVSISAIPGK
jgi:hypothetical protein